MKNQLSLILILILTSWCVASPLQLKHVTSDAGWMVHADNDQFVNSKIGGLIIDALNERGLEDKLIVFKNLFGFDPTKDLAGITLYGPDDNEQNAIAMLYGDFDVDKLLALLRANDTHQEYPYGGYEIHQWVDQHRKVMQFGSFATEKLIVIGQSADKIKNALDVLEGKAKNLSESDNLVAFDDIPKGSFLMAAGDKVWELTANKPHAAILKNTDTGIMFVGETEGDIFVDISLQVQTEEAVSNVTQIFQGMIAFAILNEETMPQLAAMARAIEIESQENIINVSILKPAEEVFEQP